MRFDGAPDVAEQRLVREGGVLQHVFEIEKDRDQQSEHETCGIERGEQFALADEAHQIDEIEHGGEKDGDLEFVVERNLRPLDGIARQQAHAEQIDRDSDRNVVDEGERKSELLAALYT